MESAIQLAEMMARGKLVPSHLHNSPGDCLMVIEASMRWQMSPFAVAQCTSVIQGKLMFEGKLVAAALNASGILSSRLDYEFSGAGQQRAVIVRGTLRGETKPREVTVFLADAKTSNSLWTKQPDQQLVYAGTRVWARRHAPEVMLGVYAPEEFDRASRSPAPRSTPRPRRHPTPATQSTTSAPARRRRPNAARSHRARPCGAGHERQAPIISDWLSAFEIAARDAQSAEEANRVICSDEAVQMKEHVTGDAKQRYDRVIRRRYNVRSSRAAGRARGGTAGDRGSGTRLGRTAFLVQRMQARSASIQNSHVDIGTPARGRLRNR